METLIKSVPAELAARNFLIFQYWENQFWIKSTPPYGNNFPLFVKAIAAN